MACKGEPLSCRHTKLTTTDIYLNATTQLLHELNERVPLTLVR
jgi:hypothetical protein